MKNNIFLFIIFLGAFGLFSCEKDETKATIDKNSFTKPALSSPSNGTALVLTKADADKTVTFTWSAADYGVPTAVKYSLQMDKKGDNFAKPVEVLNTTEITADATYASLNTKLTALELSANVAGDVEFRVMAFVPGAVIDTLYSDVVSAKATPYLAKDPFYLVGQHNGWNNATAPEFNKFLPGLKYEIYVYLAEANQGFKILPTLGSWDGDIGNDPANPGKLIPNGEQDMKVSTTGMHLIQIDMGAMTWTATPVVFSLIGDFNGWNGDLPLTYDAASNKLKVTANLTTGGVKFRVNSNWDINYGDDGANGTLEPNGANLSIGSAGSYTITLDVHAYPYTYTIVKN